MSLLINIKKKILLTQILEHWTVFTYCLQADKTC